LQLPRNSNLGHRELQLPRAYSLVIAGHRQFNLVIASRSQINLVIESRRQMRRGDLVAHE